MQTTETLAREACRGYQCDTFPEGSWVSEGGMPRTAATSHFSITATPYGFAIFTSVHCPTRDCQQQAFA